MTTEQLHNLHKARPFRPFIVHLADGRSLRVEHPEFLAYNPSGRTGVVMGRNESLEIFDLLLVTSLEVPDGEAPVTEAPR